MRYDIRFLPHVEEDVVAGHIPVAKGSFRYPYVENIYGRLADRAVTTDHESPRHSCSRSAGVSPVIRGASESNINSANQHFKAPFSVKKTKFHSLMAVIPHHVCREISPFPW